MAQYHCDVELLIDVPPRSFHPAPKVDSVFIRLLPKRQIIHPTHDLAFLDQVVKQAFAQRRKTVANALKRLVTKEAITGT